MKRYIALLAAATVIVSLAACGSDKREASGRSEKTQEQTAAADAEPASDGKILIAYFTVAENSGVDAVSSASYSMVNDKPVGRLRAIADMIQAETGGELFSIRTSVVYPADGGELIDYAANEQEEDARPELTSHIEGLDKYGTVFVGFPNWWADLPMPVYSFLESYDFSSKTIIPFITHGGSRASRTVETISELQPDASVYDNALVLSRNDVASSTDDVTAWITNIFADS